MRFLLAIILATLLLAGCGNTFYVYRENIRILLNDDNPAPITWSRVAASQFDVIEINTVQQQGWILALAFVEGGQQKFISSDHSFFYFEHGRLTRTSGLRENLLFTAPSQPDPLSLGYNALADARWQFSLDLSTRQLLTGQGQFQAQGETVIQVLDTPVNVRYYTETIELSDSRQLYTNHYWFDIKTGQLLRSKQFVPTYLGEIEVTFLSRVNRLLS